MEYKYDTAFVPVNVYRDSYDEVAADFLKHYGCEQYLSTPMAVPIFEIAKKRLNLEIITTQQLSKDFDVLGTIAFNDGYVEVYDPGTESGIAFGVKRGTVLIDCNIDNEGRENNTMAHECVHWYIHRHYFNHLHKHAADSDIAFRCPVRISDDDESTHDEERMEKQARGIAPRILMPKEATKLKLQELFCKYDYSSNDTERIITLQKIVDEIANFFCVSKISAKYRMVDLGFLTRDDSDKIYNFDNNCTAIWDFTEHPLTVKTSDRPLTRHILLEHAFYEFSKNPTFREMLQSGHFRFVENAFVINNPKYIRFNEDGEAKLTKYAIRNPQDCTLLFEYAVSVSYNYGGVSKVPANMLGLMTSVSTKYKKLPRYTANVQNDAVFDVAEALEAVKNEFDKFSSERTAYAQAKDFWERVEQIKTAKKLKNNIFKDRSGLDDATISRIKLKKTAITMRVAIATCFGLDLDLAESKKLLSLAKLALNNEPECLAYEFVIANFKDCPLFEKNAVLKDLHVEPVGVRSAG